jgi:hypothetical protein
MLTIVRRRCCNWNLEGHGVAVVVQCAKVLACCAVTLASASRVTTNNILLRVGGKVSMFRGRADATAIVVDEGRLKERRTL